MTTVNLKDRSTYYASSDLLEQLNAKIKEGDLIVNFAFTDYGGSFFDKVFIEYFLKFHPENIVSENTNWYGKNAFIFGEIVKEFIEESENYPLGFESTEEFFYEMENSVRRDTRKVY